MFFGRSLAVSEFRLAAEKMQEFFFFFFLFVYCESVGK